MDDIIFIVEGKPHLMWGFDLKGRNREYLANFDVDFFDYNMGRHLDTDDELRASVALQMSLHHSIETFFALVGSLVQAPDCTYAWLSMYSNHSLRALTQRISSEDPTIESVLINQSLTWESIAKIVFARYLPGTEKQARTITDFATLWHRLAHILLDKNERDQYNAMKHGMRGHKGGFGISFGLEPSPGVCAPAGAMQSLGYS